MTNGALPWGLEAQLCGPWLDYPLLAGSLFLSQIHS